MPSSSRVSRIRERAAALGVRHTALDLALRGTSKAGRRLEDALLELEGRRGILGPAHERWRGNSAADNRARWTGWDWSQLGEEWTESEAWKQALIDDVLLPTIPAGGTVVEIGPGGGRWTEVLAPRSERVIVVDVSQRVLDVCRERFGDEGNVEYRLTGGSSLPDVPDGGVDAVWSFDVFVHVAPLDQAGYLDEIARVLRPGGVAAIHHADGRNRGVTESRVGWRAPMTRELFAALARERGLALERQFDSWGGGRYGLAGYADAFSVLRQPS